MKELRKQIWFINQILTALKKQHHSQYSDILAKTEKLTEKLNEVTTETRKIQKAIDHRWLSASSKSKLRLERALNDLPYLISNAKQFIARPVNKVPTFRDLMAEFGQLKDEFGDVTFDMENKSISITSESIELDDTYLGEFKIELRIDKLTEAHRMAPYYVIALDPHPAATSSDVTHPHVSNDILCEGDGHTAICTALEQGRICDFFNMIESILNTYNPDSPYVPLNEWDGRSCYDCGYVCDSESSYYCSCCDNDFCSECSSYCRMCDETICLGCGGSCECCEELICKHCAKQCTECSQYCCDQCLENGVCKSCQEERIENEEETETIESSKTLTPMKKDHRWALRFSPTAWAKLLYFRDKSENEIGGFGITAQDDLLFVQDLVTVKQKVTFASVRFEDEAVANFFEDQVDLGRSPQQFARIWVHCHPGDCPRPSSVDEDTFARVFGGCDFAIMFIVARGNESYARISFNVGPGGQVLIPVEVDYGEPFEGSNHKRWDQEFEENVYEEVFERTARGSQQDIFGNDMLPYDVMEELDQMDEHERQLYLDELALDPGYYDREEVLFL